MVLAFTKSSTKILGLKVRFQIYFELPQQDFTLLEKLITVSSGTGTLPSSKVKHTRKKIKLKKHFKPAETK